MAGSEGMVRDEDRAADAFRSGSPWGDCRPAGWGAFWLGVARSFPGSWPWSRFALLARRAARRHLAGPVDTRVWGHRLRLFPGRSVSEARILFLPRAWDRTERRRIAKWVRPGFTFVDVGANVGGYSFWVLSLIGASGRVVTVEPNPDLARQLRYNVRVNGAGDRMLVVEAAVGAARTSGALVLNPRNTGESRLARGDAEHPAAPAADGLTERRKSPGLARGSTEHAAGVTVPVDVVTLADVVREAGLYRLDCLKVDVEGHESEVLRPYLRMSPRELWPRRLIVELKRGPRDRRQSSELETWLAARGSAWRPARGSTASSVWLEARSAHYS